MRNPSRSTTPGRWLAHLATISLLASALLPLAARYPVAAAVEHLVISEVATGGASASDELIEIYNPSPATLPLEGLELIYVTSTGTTISRRAAWGVDAPLLAPGTHVLVANELGIFAPIADVLYASGMAATGGSVALRIQGASSAIDAVGWGTATSTWLEGTPATAPPAGSSLERLPGGAAGSSVDTNENASDFTVRAVPEPQNLGSSPVPAPSTTPTVTSTPLPSDSTEPTATPSATAEPSPSGPPTTPPATPTPTPTVPPPSPTSTPGATPTPAPSPMSIATAREMPDGSFVTVAGVALTASSFSEGGGYVADATAGIAVLIEGGAFERGDSLNVSGPVDDRFAQRTIRADADDVLVTGAGAEPDPIAASTGSVGEPLEGRLVRIGGAIDGTGTTLTSGLAFDVDDGTGPVRVLVGTGTGVDTTEWSDGRRIEVVGVVGQRDSSGTGTAGYRVQPRDSDDVSLLGGPVPTPSASASASEAPAPSASPSPSDPDGGTTISIADARAAGRNARVRIRGVVTLASGAIEPGTAVIQDASGAILLRLADEAGPLAVGQLVELHGVRSTKSGMESLRVTLPPRQLGTAADPPPAIVRTGDAGEALEARLILVRGAVVASARRASSGTVSFDIDDGSGPLRVVVAATLAADDDALVGGSWVEIRGVLGQETTGAQPQRGYRVWPRSLADVRIVAAAGEPDDGASSTAADGTSAAGGGGGAGAGRAAGTRSLDALDRASLAGVRIAATLVTGAWPELGVGGLLWDGQRLVTIAAGSGRILAEAIGDRAPPLPVVLVGVRRDGSHPRLGVPNVTLGHDAGHTTPAPGRAARPRGTLPDENEGPAWVTVVGRAAGRDGVLSVRLDAAVVPVDYLCPHPPPAAGRLVNVTGIASAAPPRLVVPCGGIRLAPTVGLARARVGVTDDARERFMATAAPETAGGGPALQRRLAAAALLVAGVTLVLTAAVVSRRRSANESRVEDAAPEEEGAQPAESLEPADAGDARGGPRLTLVSVPREHGG